jgi:hypothetical protein
MAKFKKILVLPFEDFLSALDNAVGRPMPVSVFLIVVSFIVSWWIYVPLHELFHALGCILSGGTVSELDISPKYGGTFLSKIFLFVRSGSRYAGQLIGFDTGGNDLTYLLTVFFPYLLTIFIGVPLLRAARFSSHLGASIKFGVSLPIAFAPLISVSGDYYEVGSIITSRIGAFLFHTANITRWRSDDLFKLSKDIFFSGSPFELGDTIGVLFSFILGVIFIYLTYLLGAAWSLVLSRRPDKKPAVQ